MFAAYAASQIGMGGSSLSLFAQSMGSAIAPSPKIFSTRELLWVVMPLHPGRKETLERERADRRRRAFHDSSKCTDLQCNGGCKVRIQIEYGGPTENSAQSALAGFALSSTEIGHAQTPCVASTAHPLGLPLAVRQARHRRLTAATQIKARIVEIAMPQLPLDPLIPTLLNILSAFIEDGNWQSEDARRATANAIVMLPATCSEARNLALEDKARWSWLIAYELARTRTGPTLRLFDGIPAAIQRLHKPPAIRPLSQNRNKIAAFQTDVTAIHEGRMLFARIVEKDLRGISSGRIKQWNLDGCESDYMASDLPITLPARVRCFADYCRWQVQAAFCLDLQDGLACALPRCARRKCNRRAHPDFTFEHGLTQGTMRAYRTTNSDSNEITYFKMLRSIVLDYADDPVEAPALRCYCSTHCSLLAADEYDQCVRCCTLEEMDSYAAPSRNDRPSSAKQLRAAIARNQTIARRMRSQRHVQELKHWEEQLLDVTEERERVVHMLNLDTALLYVASLVCELPPGLKPTCMMPAANGWRARAMIWATAMNKIVQIYRPHSVGAELIQSTVSLPRWARKIKDRCLEILR